MENPRECALDVLIKVDKKEELSHIAISNVLEKYQFSEKRDRAFFTRLVEGTLERQIMWLISFQKQRSENANL